MVLLEKPQAVQQSSLQTWTAATFIRSEKHFQISPEHLKECNINDILVRIVCKHLLQQSNCYQLLNNSNIRFWGNLCGQKELLRTLGNFLNIKFVVEILSARILLITVKLCLNLQVIRGQNKVPYILIPNSCRWYNIWNQKCKKNVRRLCARDKVHQVLKILTPF